MHLHTGVRSAVHCLWCSNCGLSQSRLPGEGHWVSLISQRSSGRRQEAEEPGVGNKEQPLFLPTPSFMIFALSRPSGYSARDLSGAVESPEPSTPTVPVARTWCTVLRRYDELPIPTYPVRMRMATPRFPFLLVYSLLTCDLNRSWRGPYKVSFLSAVR